MSARPGGRGRSRGPGRGRRGPGVVGYPVIDLSPDRRDVHRYVRDLEEVLIRAVSHFDITAGRVSGLTGVWTGNDKLAPIGERSASWVTTPDAALTGATSPP